MAGKRKTKRPMATREDLAKPSPWRRQHGDFAEPVREADPDTGTTVVHHHAVDTLGQMLVNGTITQEMHDAGAIFRARFRAAALDGMRTMPLIRLAKGHGDGMTERQVHARQQIADTLVALGGFDSAAGSVIWHVVGLEYSVREWAMRQGWGGKLVSPAQAQGMLVAALGVLAAVYGFGPGRRAA